MNFSFADGTRLLHGVTFKVGRGESIGIVGPIGAGKSTLIKLVSGMLEPPIGSVYINGHDVARLSHNDWIGSLSLVPQRSFMFGGTLKHNLSLGEELTDDQLWAVLDIVELGQDVRRWPDQLNSKLGEWGVNLSGGQRQRLALARALLRTRDILLLDDCLSAVDAETEERILVKILPLLQSRTCIWIAHRASTLRLCQRVFELVEGRLVPLLSEPVDGALQAAVTNAGGEPCLV